MKWLSQLLLLSACSGCSVHQATQTSSAVLTASAQLRTHKTQTTKWQTPPELVGISFLADDKLCGATAIQERDAIFTSVIQHASLALPPGVHLYFGFEDGLNSEHLYFDPSAKLLRRAKDLESRARPLSALKIPKDPFADVDLDLCVILWSIEVFSADQAEVVAKAGEYGGGQVVCYYRVFRQDGDWRVVSAQERDYL